MKLTKTDRNAFFMQYKPLVHKFAYKLHAQYAKVPLEDFESWGWISLYEVIDRYDPERGSTFLTYAYSTLPWRMKRAVNEFDWLKKYARDRYGDELARVCLFEQKDLQELSIHTDKHDRQVICKDLIAKALKGLTARRQKIWWMWVDTGNYAEVGRELNLTRQRIEQIIKPIMKEITRLAGN